MLNWVCVQSGDYRVVFSARNGKILVEWGHNVVVGSSWSSEYMSVERAEDELAKLMGMGYKKFRNAREVSWAATWVDRLGCWGYPDEEWTVDGEFLVPIKSDVLA